MKTVWAIEQGSYSDYHVVGIYSTKEKADAVAAKLGGGYDTPTVVEWPLDPAADEVCAGLEPWRVYMLYDGTVERVERQEAASGYEILGSTDIHHRGTSNAPVWRGKQDCLFVACWATDVEHAVKIANEKRAQKIALGEFQPPKVAQ